jgi:SAM-dependent methyltransferase
MINIGCGKVRHDAWINLDLVGAPGVKSYNVKKDLPFPDNSIDIIYHSHILEHLRKNEAERFIKECHRILKPGGLIRVVVPDLEKLCEEYLKNLRKGFENGDESAILDYQWNKIEMFDQMIREKQGGALSGIINNPPKNKDYIISRVGKEIFPDAGLPDPRLDKKIIRAAKKLLLLLLAFRLTEAFSYIKREILDNFFFDSAGEKHRWAYDRLDLKIILEKSGFKNFSLCSYDGSKIDNWTSYNLDNRPEGGPRRPDSIYAEARK